MRSCFAAATCSCFAYRLLLEYGADVEALDSEEWSPFHWACQLGNVFTARLLMSKGDSDLLVPVAVLVLLLVLLLVVVGVLVRECFV